MTGIRWAAAIDGLFSDAADWRGGSVPGLSDRAVLDATGADFTVTASVNEDVAALRLAANATLAITGGTFTAAHGAPRVGNAGQITVGDGAVFVVGGRLDGEGGVTLEAGGALRLDSDATLAGGATLTLAWAAGQPYAQIVGTGPVHLTNLDDTIAGAGSVGESGGFQFINGADGVIDADVGGARLLVGYDDFPDGRVVNNGLMEAGSGSFSDFHDLRITCASLTGNGGRIFAGAYADVAILAGRVAGQTFSTDGHGAIDFFGGQILDTADLANAGGLVLSGATLTLAGAVTLSGGGGVYLDHQAKVGASTAGAVLTNVDNYVVLSGGRLGGGTLSLINEAAGTIHGSGVIAAGAAPIVNTGVIEARQLGVGDQIHVLTIHGALDNAGLIETAANGTLIVTGAVTGSGQAVIVSGHDGGGEIAFSAAFSQDVDFVRDGRPVRGADPLAVLALADSQNYAGAVSGFSAKGRTALDLGDIAFVSAGEATFAGTAASGVLTVTDGTHTAHITLIGDFLQATFTAAPDAGGGVVVTAQTAGARLPALAPAFATAMASLGARPGSGSGSDRAAIGERGGEGPAMLLAPRLARP